MSTPRWHMRSLMLGTALYAFVAVVPQGDAQVATAITSDGTLGTTVAPSCNLYNINGGTIKGTNQFHSFGQFSVGTGDIASFNGPTTIQNILSRVTGGTRSEIDGTLRSTISGANLFLLNPSGILFGPNAQLDVSGSFHGTTADYIGLADGTRFNAVPSSADNVLTTAPPAAFGFLTSNPAPIDVQTGVVDFEVGAFTNVLQVPAGQTLSFVGGPINIGAAPEASVGGLVFAPGGRINLVSVASQGEARFDGTGFSVDTFAGLGDISIKGNSVIDGKEVFIRGGRLVIEGANILPGFFFQFGGAGAPPNGGEVNIQVSDSVTIKGPPSDFNGFSGILTFAGLPFPGDVPNITIKAPSVSLSEGGLIQTVRQGPGNPSNVTIEADTVEVRSGASVAALNFFEGPGGTLTVNARDVTLDSAGSDQFTGFSAQAFFHGDYGLSDETGSFARAFLPSLQLADSGSITVNATGTLTMRGSAQITTDNFAFGKSGNITVNAGDMLLVGAGTNTGLISAQSSLAGQSGAVTVNAAGSIDMQNGFRISANTLGGGDGGQVNVRAGRSITMSGNSTFISSVTDQPLDIELDSFAQLFAPFFGVEILDYPALRAALGVAPSTGDLMKVLAALSTISDGAGNSLLAVTDFTPGTGGKVSVTAPVLTVNDGAHIETSTIWDGNAGAIAVNVGSLRLHDGAIIGSRSGAVRLDRGFTVGTGNAGTIDIIATDTVEISGRSPTSEEGSIVTTNTFGDGQAGNISLSANQVNVQNGGSVTSASGGTVDGQLFVGAGNAGQIGVSAPTLKMADGGRISVATQGAGHAGSIALNVDNLTQTAGSTIDSSTSGAGQGGNLAVTAANSASISGTGTGLFSTASGSGAGGNIHVQAGQVVKLADNATVSAQSTGTATATAGNVTINTPTFETQNASVTTGATLADGGNISITTTGSLVHLTDSQITTSVQSGVGTGGNITVNSELVVLDGSQILANAFGGPGGNINIVADVFLVNSGGQSPTSLAGIVEASSALSTPGTINIEATVTDVSGTVAQLPEAPLQATELLRAACAARFVGGKASSLVLGGRDGLPHQPGNLLPSPPYLASKSDSPSTISGSSGFSSPAGFSLLGSSDRPLHRYSLLPNFKCSL
jgi:filamentous hemagglutinin family protein